MPGESALPVPPSQLPSGVWVVIAAFNERLRIGKVLEDVLAVVSNVVVVDDGSTDGTPEVTDRTGSWLVVHPVNLGQGAALQTGISFALQQGATHIVTFDADGQHDAQDIRRLVAALETSGAVFALGSRFLGQAQGIPRLRRIMLRLAVVFTQYSSGIKLTDTHNGLRAMTRDGAERLLITQNRMEHASELLEQIGQSRLPFVEVPVTIRYTAASLLKGQRTSAAIGLAVRLLLNKVSR